MKYRPLVSCLVCWVACTHFAVAFEKDAQPKKVVAARPLRIADADDWQSVTQFALSPDGQWSAQAIMPNEGDGKILIARTQDTSPADDDAKAAPKPDEAEKDKSTPPYEFEVGPGSGRFEFSHDSKFVAFMDAPKDKAAKASKKSGEPAQSKAVLLNLSTGKKTEFESVAQLSFSGENPKCLAISKTKPKGRPEGDKGWNGTDLLIHDLVTGTEINIGNVKNFAFNKSGKLLAMTTDAQGKSGNGVQLFHVDQAKLETLDSDKAIYKALAWTREGDALSLLKSQKDEAYENERHSLLAFSDVGGTNQKKTLLDPVEDAAIADDMTISPNRTPFWNDERTAVFFGIHALEKKEDEEKQDDEGSDKKKPASENSQEKSADLVVWHWNDPRLQSMQQMQESRDKNRSDLCVHFVADGNSMRLADEEIPEVSVSRPYKFAVGTDNQKYERMGNLDGVRLRDVYTIDLKSRKRKLVLEGARYVFDVSPDGQKLLYYKDDGHFYVYNMLKGTHTNITAKADVSFVDVEDDHNVTNPPARPIGWTTSGDYVLLSDGWDIWKVSADGDEAINLTLNGKAEQIRYSNPRRFDPDVLGIDLSQPVYISAYGEWTKKAGFGRIHADAPGVEMLVWDDASFGALNKLEDHDIYTFTRATRNDAPTYLVSGPDLKDPRPLTDLKKQQEAYQWSAGVKLVDYTDSNGNKLQGALHLPADYIEGKKYPTIVYMYEKLSQTANRFDAPRTGGFSAAIYNSNGYAVFNPDIVFQINDPGMSSKDCILAGLDAAIATGIVDPEHVGLHGHSWGGYQTAFLITQTDRFQAAVAGAPLTNMISMYSSIYWNSGSANQPIFESSQGRFTGGYWDNLDAYARNSPVYYADQVVTPLLLLHNDADGAVDWNQGIEYFNTLRRLSKPVVMLQYTGENHGLRDAANRKDYSYRMLDFFNHYLKGEEAPAWWSEGIKHLDMKEHIEDYQKAKAQASED